jgi:hypothetical protein
MKFFTKLINMILAAIRMHLQNGCYKSSILYGAGKADQRIADLLATVPLTVDKRLVY